MTSWKDKALTLPGSLSPAAVECIRAHETRSTHTAGVDNARDTFLALHSDRQIVCALLAIGVVPSDRVLASTEIEIETAVLEIFAEPPVSVDLVYYGTAAAWLREHPLEIELLKQILADASDRRCYALWSDLVRVWVEERLTEWEIFAPSTLVNFGKLLAQC